MSKEIKIYSDLAKQILNNDNTALLVIDVQKKFCDPMYYGDEESVKIAKKIQSLCPEFRKASIPVFAIYLGHENEEPNFYEFTPSNKDVIVRKSTSSAFKDCDAEMDKKLQEHNIKNLLICGFNLTACVIETASDAKKFGYKTYVLDEMTGDVSAMKGEYNRDEMNKWMSHIGVKVIKSEKLIDCFKNPTSSEFNNVAFEEENQGVPMYIPKRFASYISRFRPRVM